MPYPEEEWKKLYPELNLGEFLSSFLLAELLCPQYMPIGSIMKVCSLLPISPRASYELISFRTILQAYTSCAERRDVELES